MNADLVRENLARLEMGVLNSGYVDDEYDIWAKALVHVFVAGELSPNPRDGRVTSFPEDKARVDALYAFLQSLLYMHSREKQKSFLLLVQDSVRAIFDENTYRGGSDPLALFTLTMADEVLQNSSGRNCG